MAGFRLTARRILRDRMWPAFFWALGGLFAAIIVFWAIRPQAAPPWTGFTSPAGSRTLWDWLQLLLLPLAVIAAAWFLVSRPGAAIATAAPLARDYPDEAARAESQERRLNAFFDQLTALLFERGLREAPDSAEVRRVARALTLTAIWDLDGGRKGRLLRFLYELQLISLPRPVVPLAGANLSAADLSSMDLRAADLRDAVLRRANLRAARLDAADFAGADLSGADLRHALGSAPRPAGSKWRPPNLSGANLFRANLHHANLAESDLTGVVMREANLDAADFREAILNGSRLDGASLRATNLKGASMREAVLSGANLTGAQLIGTRLPRARLVKVRLNGANLWQVNLHEASLGQADLQSANLTKAYLYRCDLRGADLRGAGLQGANLSGADLTDAHLDGADLRGAYLTAARVTTEQLKKAKSLEGAALPDHVRLRAGAADGQAYYFQVAANDSTA
jgi:uncharacterized protein YjbI with pentapeptide repeats